MARFRRFPLTAGTMSCLFAAATVSGVGVGAGRMPPAQPVASILRPPGASTPSVAELQERFDREDNPVRKAKLIQKLGDAQFEALHAAEKTDDYVLAGVTLEKYRDNVRTALEALKKEHPDVERNSNGYRQLQIHARRGIKETEDALRSAPDELRPPLELVRRDLVAMDDEMLELLFPKPVKKKDATHG